MIRFDALRLATTRRARPRPPLNQSTVSFSRAVQRFYSRFSTVVCRAAPNCRCYRQPPPAPAQPRTADWDWNGSRVGKNSLVLVPGGTGRAHSSSSRPVLWGGTRRGVLRFRSILSAHPTARHAPPSPTEDGAGVRAGRVCGRAGAQLKCQGPTIHRDICCIVYNTYL